jgi:hypothetical protein
MDPYEYRNLQPPRNLGPDHPAVTSRVGRIFAGFSAYLAFAQQHRSRRQPGLATIATMQDAHLDIGREATSRRSALNCSPDTLFTPRLTRSNEAGGAMVVQVVAVAHGVPADVVAVWSQPGGSRALIDRVTGPLTSGFGGAPRGIRTPNHQIRSLVTVGSCAYTTLGRRHSRS